MWYEINKKLIQNFKKILLWIHEEINFELDILIFCDISMFTY